MVITTMAVPDETENHEVTSVEEGQDGPTRHVALGERSVVAEGADVWLRHGVQDALLSLSASRR